MTREEIREGIAEQIYFNHPRTRNYEVAGRIGIPYTWKELDEVNKDEYREEADNMMILLDSKDVVIKVDNPGWTLVDTSVEPLIKGKANG